MAWILASLLALPAFASQPSSSKPNDQKIQQDINKQLQDNKAWKNVQANIDSGVVTLTGTVDLFRDKQKLDEKIRKRSAERRRASGRSVGCRFETAGDTRRQVTVRPHLFRSRFQ
jgi:hypothetical protein